MARRVRVKMTLFNYLAKHFRIIACDSEFQPVAGEMPNVLCFVFKDCVTGEVWHCESKTDIEALPFDWEQTLLVAHNVYAEALSLLAWEIPLPEYWICTWIESKNVFQNGNNPKGFFTQLNVAKILEVPDDLIMDADEKNIMRDLILDNAQWSSSEWKSIIDYCEEDTVCCAALFPLLCKKIEETFERPIEHTATQMLVRGQAKSLEAQMYANGIPVDTKSYNLFQEQWPNKKSKFIEQKNKILNVFEEGIFKQDLFENLLRRLQLYSEWPKTKTGKCSTADGTLEEYEEVHPHIKLLRAVKNLIASGRLKGLEVGKDGRSRAEQKFFSTITGRAAPSSTNYPFVAPRWLRTFIHPPAGKVLAYIDFSHEEPCIQAALSKDPNLTEAVKGDVYMYTANDAGALRGVNDPDKVKSIRTIFKTTFLALSYGMGDWSVAAKTRATISQAREMIASIKHSYRVYYKWISNVVQMFKITGRMTTRHGWARSCKNVQSINNRSLENWPIQAHGAEILYWAIINIHKAGFKLIATVHDAVLVEFDVSDRIILDVYEVRKIMTRCAKDIVGMEIKTDVEMILYNWEQAKDAKALYDEIMELVGSDLE